MIQKIQKKKLLLTNELKTIFSVSKFFYIIDIEGLNANTVSLFRKICFENKVKIKSVKNTLIKKAINQINNQNLIQLCPYFRGNTAILVCDIENLPAKLIQNFRKKFNKPILKVAWIDGSIFIGDNSLNILSTLKSKEELIVELIYNTLQSPMKKMFFSTLKIGDHLITGLLQKLSER